MTPRSSFSAHNELKTVDVVKSVDGIYGVERREAHVVDSGE